VGRRQAESYGQEKKLDSTGPLMEAATVMERRSN